MEYLTRWRMLLAGDRLRGLTILLLRSPRRSATKQRAPLAGHLKGFGAAPLGNTVDPMKARHSHPLASSAREAL